MTFNDWIDAVIVEAAKREFPVDRDDDRLQECFDYGFDPYDTVDGFIEEACDYAALSSRAPL